jgi:hypothetical protein
LVNASGFQHTDSPQTRTCVYSHPMGWLLDKAFGGVVGYVVSTILGAMFIVLGIAPSQSLAAFLDQPWVTNPWTRIAIVIIGVAIIMAASLWKIFSERRSVTKNAADLAQSEFLGLIDSARNFTSITIRQDPGEGHFRKMLASDPIFFKLRPRLSEEFLRALLSGRVILVEVGANTGVPALASSFLRELDRIEKEGRSAMG